MLDKQKDEITKLIKEAKEKGTLSASYIKKIVSNAIATVKDDAKNKKSEEDISRSLMETILETLGEFKKATKENINAAIDGLAEGVKRVKPDSMNGLQGSISSEISTKSKSLREGLSKVINEIEHAASAVKNETKGIIQSSIDMMGSQDSTADETDKLMKEQSRKIVALLIGRDYSGIESFAKDTTILVLSKNIVTIKSIKKSSIALLKGATEVTDENPKFAKETLRALLKGVVSGVHEIVDKIEMELAQLEELNEMQKAQQSVDFGNSEDIFIAILKQSAANSSEVSRKILLELATSEENNIFGFAVERVNSIKEAILTFIQIKNSVKTGIDGVKQAKNKVSYIAKNAVKNVKNSVSKKSN